MFLCGEKAASQTSRTQSQQGSLQPQPRNNPQAVLPPQGRGWWSKPHSAAEENELRVRGRTVYVTGPRTPFTQHRGVTNGAGESP